MARKIGALALIYSCTALAWFLLGSTVFLRTDTQDRKLKSAVGKLWGGVQEQRAPSVEVLAERAVKSKETGSPGDSSAASVELSRRRVPIESSDIEVGLSLEHRRKGLIWYPTYVVRFSGDYSVVNNGDEPRNFYLTFVFPTEGAVYDDFRISLQGKEKTEVDLKCGKVTECIFVEPGKTGSFGVSYKSQGMGEWWYDFGENVEQVKKFSLAVTTDFERFDFPQNSMSPTRREKIPGGSRLEWNYANLFTGTNIGIELPSRLNPGPWAGQVIFSAPVSLLLFFFVVFVCSALRRVEINPMNYFFVAAAFFSFHLLLAYLVDHIPIHAAFVVSSVVSMVLVLSYMRLVVGWRFAFLAIGLSQFIYQVLFSYTFFFRGFTGLAITVLCIVTLFITMQLTARYKWESEPGGKRGVA